MQTLSLQNVHFSPFFFSFSLQKAGPHPSQECVFPVGCVSGSVSGESVSDSSQHAVALQLQLLSELAGTRTHTLVPASADRHPAQIPAHGQTPPTQTQPAPPTASRCRPEPAGARGARGARRPARAGSGGEHVYR